MSAFLYCPDCATPYAALDWPRHCQRCGSVHAGQEAGTAGHSLSEPPLELLAVPMVRVLRERSRDGVIGIQANNGQWSLPWIRVRAGEQIEVAAARGIEEMCGIGVDPYIFRPDYSRIAPGGKVLVFLDGPKIPESLLEEARVPDGYKSAGVLDFSNPPTLPLQAQAVIRLLRPPVVLTGNLAGNSGVRAITVR
jgi:hypothetical protein